MGVDRPADGKTTAQAGGEMVDLVDGGEMLGWFTDGNCQNDLKGASTCFCHFLVGSGEILKNSQLLASVQRVVGEELHVSTQQQVGGHEPV